jgi:hypothetical protein
VKVGDSGQWYTVRVRRTRVTSSSLVSVGYREDQAELEIELVSGAVYRYFMVPRAEYDGLMSAPSIGRYFNEHIRNGFPFERAR